MDIRMPVMDGYTATRKLRSLPRADARTIPIPAITADAFEEDTHLAPDAGTDGYLTKPIDPQRPCRTLSDTIQNSRLCQV